MASCDRRDLTVTRPARADPARARPATAPGGVARGDRPGDPVFRGSPTIYHVGIYIGDGRMTSDPQTGDVVKISKAVAGEYVGAVRR